MTQDHTVAELIRRGEDDTAAFEERMRLVIPLYQVGDRVELLGEVFEVEAFERDSMPGYWLRGDDDDLFVPVDLEGVLRRAPW
jgi:hypothetical protein